MDHDQGDALISAVGTTNSKIDTLQAKVNALENELAGCVLLFVVALGLLAFLAVKRR